MDENNGLHGACAVGLAEINRALVALKKKAEE